MNKPAIKLKPWRQGFNFLNVNEMFLQLLKPKH